MPSRSPFLMSTFQDTGIQVEFDSGDSDHTTTNLGDPSISLSVAQDDYVIVFCAGRDVVGATFSSSDYYQPTLSDGTTFELGGTDNLTGFDIRQAANQTENIIMNAGGTLTVTNNSGGSSDGGAIAGVVIQNGYDVTDATANAGSTASISNVSPSDVVLIWENRQNSTTVPSTPSGFTSIGSGTYSSGRGGNIYNSTYRLSYKDNASGTVSHTSDSSIYGGVHMVVIKRILKDYELSSYGAPDYTITSFPSTGTGVSSGTHDILAAVDTTISYSWPTGDEGLIMDLGGAGIGFAWGLDNGTTMRARVFDGGGNFRDGGTDALAAADVQQSISAYRNRACTFYIRVDASALNMRLYVQIGGQGSHHPIRLLESNTNNGTALNPYGGNTKGYGQVGNSVADLVGLNGTGAYHDNYTGTIDEIRYWAEAGAPDVSGFAASYDTVTP